MVVVDASVYVAMHQAADRHHSRCLEWFERCLSHRIPLAAPYLLVAEASGAVRRLTGDQTQASLLAEKLLSTSVIELFALDERRARMAAAVSAEAGVRGADAVYLALAQELRAALVTMDRQQLERGSPVARVERPR